MILVLARARHELDIIYPRSGTATLNPVNTDGGILSNDCIAPALHGIAWQSYMWYYDSNESSKNI